MKKAEPFAEFRQFYSAGMNRRGCEVVGLITTAATAAAAAATAAAAVTATVTAITATAATAVSTTATTAATAATTVGRAFFTRTCFIDRKRAALERLAVERGDGRVHAFGGVHGHERETAWATGGAVHGKGAFGDCAVGSKKVTQVVFGGVEGKIPDIHFGVHMVYLRSLTAYFFDCSR